MTGFSTTPLPFTAITGAIALTTLSGVPLLLTDRKGQAQRLSAAIQILAGIIGISGAVAVLYSELHLTGTIDTGLPFGPLEFGIDPLSALFLLPIFLVSACCTLYAVAYWPTEEHPGTVARIHLFFGTMAAAVAGLTLARNGILFLFAWEIMALSCYFALTAEDDKAEVREAGTLYLITTHLGTLALFGLFALLRSCSGSFAFPLHGSISAATMPATVIFVAALFGFGLKAGLMPLHIWLPSAHANAPSHVSAFMSGLLIKMGIYGLIRTFSFFNQIPAWWGATILVAGIVSAILGVAFALGQHDIKRLLAYHSIENIGIIAMGIGIALIGQHTGSSTLVLLGMAGALLHVINHATFKSLLFLGAGSVIHACDTREIDRLGGLARSMPLTAFFFLTGAAAICGLPPLNGFVSELLIYLGAFTGVTHGGPGLAYLALAIPALALVGGLAVACFVKVFGIVFLGQPREADIPVPHEAGRPMLIPMGTLAGVCLIIGIFPQVVAPLLERAVFAYSPGLALAGSRLSGTAPFGWLTAVNLGVLLLLAILAVVYRRQLANSPAGTTETWGCGYLAPTPRMQYTATSFAAMLVQLTAGILRPYSHRPEIRGIFPRPSYFRSHVPEAFLELCYLPFLQWANERLSLFRRLQHGQLHLYILYILMTLVLLLAWGHV